MENRLKERLTGAAILVALIVLLVPEMFHGQRGDVAASAGGGEGAPVRSYTIDLSNSPARTAPLQSTPGTSGASSGGDTAAEPAPAHVTPHPASESPPPARGDSAVNPAPARVPAASNAPRKRGSASAPEQAGAGAWSVQLGLFAQRDNAERLARSAQGKGFAVSVSGADAKGRFHVRVSGLVDRPAAQVMQQRLRDQGFTAAMVAP